eukprot:scaffold12826_cov75-Skeletonema_dohrnii-CCMP3373.AAC.2
MSHNLFIKSATPVRAHGAARLIWRVQGKGRRGVLWSSTMTMSSLSSSWDETGITKWGYDTNTNIA